MDCFARARHDEVVGSDGLKLILWRLRRATGFFDFLAFFA